MKSKFKIVSYFIPLLFLLMTGLFIKTLINIETTFTSWETGSFVLFIMFLSILLLIFEMRDKIVSIQITENELRIKRYVGIGNTFLIRKYDIDGFHKSIVSTKYGSYDYLYLMKNNKKVAKVSNQYHKNFNELSSEIGKQYKDLGFIYSGFISEIKDFFKTN